MLRKSLKILKRLFLTILLLLLVVYILLHFSPIQTWVVKQVTAQISKDLNARVSVNKVDFSFFNRMSVKGVMVEDQHKDTLLYAGTASVKLTDWFFFKDNITLHYISLEDAVINLKRTDSTWNYGFLVDYFSSPGTKKSSKNGIKLDLDEIHLRNIRFKSSDKWIGQDMTVTVEAADIDIDRVDHSEKQVIINDIYLDQPLFSLSDYSGNKPVSNTTVDIVNEISKGYRLNNSGWTVRLKKIQLHNGGFSNDKETGRAPYSDHFDGMHLSFRSITGSIEEVTINQDTIKANVYLSAKEKNGLIIRNISSAMRVTPEIMEFNDLDLVTNSSHIGDYYAMHYKNFNNDMRNFLKDVTLEGKFKNTTLSSDDLAIFAPELKKWKRVFEINGNVSGPVENLGTNKVKIKSGNSVFDGDISLRGLPDINSTFIDLKANSLKTNYADLVTIIPTLKKIQQPGISKLGTINYRGNFTGFLNDFVTYGTISTNLGIVKADLNMKLPEMGVPTYSGKIFTQGFKLGEFLGDGHVGSISLNGSVAGSGFSLDKLNAHFDGDIRQIEFNGYNYQNLSVKGDFRKSLFTGHLTIDDPNLQIKNLDGSLSLSGKEIAFNLDADLQYANLKNIHFSKDSFELKGLLSLNFTGNNIDNFLGTARMYNASLKHDSTLLSFDSLNLTSLIKDNKKYLTLKSNEIDAEIAGKFSIMELPDAFKVFLSRYYPAYIKTPAHRVSDQDFTFSIQTKQVSEYLALFDKRLHGLNHSSISGRLNLADYDLTVHAAVPEFEYDEKKFYNIKLSGNGNRDTLNAGIEVDKISISDSLQFPDTKLLVTANNDISDIHLQTSAGNTLNDANLNASIQTLSDGVKVHFSPSSFIINNKKWELAKDGELTVRKNYLDANEIKFVHENQQILLSTELNKETNETNVVARLKNIDIGDFTPFILNEPQLKGYLTGTATIIDPLGKFGLSFKGNADSFSLDKKYLGKVELDASANTITGDIEFETTVHETENDFKINGRYNYKDTSCNNMEVNALAGRISLDILEPYLGSIFSGIEGYANSNLKISCRNGHKYITGEVMIESGSLKVAYTQCKYHLENEKLVFREDEIDLGSIKLKDSLNNEGSISGKMNHHFFRDFSFNNIRFETPKMLLLNTGKKDNSQFYGNVIGNALMTLNGPVTNLVMNITGQPSIFDSSHIYLPNSSSKESNAVDYIEFVQFGSVMEDAAKVNQSTNIVVNMNLQANPSCKIDVILDEETGDIIKGQGSGSLNIRVGNKEPLSIRGKYELTKGEYTFNFQTFLKKPFTLNRGSITWNGDPLQAIIDIEAEYLAQGVDLSSLNPVNNVNSGTPVRQKEDITIISHLTGNLRKPKITFEFQLPEKSNLRRDYLIVKKLEDFKNDENEMNKQVASLLLFNTFITGNQNFLSGGNILSQATSTIGGMVSGWLTNLFNKELLKATNGILSTYIDINPTVNLQLSQLQATVRAGVKIFLSNRIFFLIGGNLDYNNPYTQLNRKGLLTPDITIEWLLNKDGTLRVVGFNRTSVDITSGQRNRSGIQLSYRKDFNKLSDIFKSKKRIDEEEKAWMDKNRTQVKISSE